MNAKNFYIVATVPNEPSLQVKVSGPYLTEQAAQADLVAAIDEAMDIDPSAKDYQYSISRVESRKPGVIQHMATDVWPVANLLNLNKPTISRLSYLLFLMAVGVN